MINLNGLNGLNGYYNRKTNNAKDTKETDEANNGKSSGKNAETASKTGAGDSSIKSQVDALREQVDKITGKNSSDRNGAVVQSDTDKSVANSDVAGAAKENSATNEVVTADTPETVAAASSSFMDRLKEMQNGFVNQLMESLGLGSLKDGGKGVDLAGGLMSGFTDLLKNLGGFGDQVGKNGMSALGISAQYSLNVSTVMTVMNADGSMSQQSVNFSLEASFDYLSVASGKGGGANTLDQLLGKGKSKNTDQAKGADNDFMAKMREMFSPEKTAQRILDFSLSFFNKSKMFKAMGDTAESRNQFADYIGAAIQKGFDQARGILGKKLPQETSDEIDQTHSLVFGGLDDFRAGKNNPNSEVGNMYNQLQYFASSLSVNYSSTSVYYSPEEVKKMQAANGRTAYAAVAKPEENEKPEPEKTPTTNALA